MANSNDSIAPALLMTALTVPLLYGLIAGYLIYRMVRPVVSKAATGVSDFLFRQSKYWLSRTQSQSYPPSSLAKSSNSSSLETGEEKRECTL